eukprot:CAMPEP_0180602574 /NCGR_PEP_ID=MMETSP1037_2-20121125/25054_1 /TAXON_ID=632150 /ORGANISM="Azadinium spinosum, Strain 3D9" /LENGTH=171 /DNA_ID=CAMNT_0022621425 /DNA_START=80 /DNA_END=595 /DNA_ORIENTATION=+
MDWCRFARRRRRPLATAVLVVAVAIVVVANAGVGYTLPPSDVRERLSESGLPPPPAMPIGLDCLEEALAASGLEGRTVEAQLWCEEQGAAELEEVVEEVESLGSALSLGEADVEKLRNSLIATMDAAVQRKEEQDKQAREAMALLGAEVLRGQAKMNVAAAAHQGHTAASE